MDGKDTPRTQRSRAGQQGAGRSGTGDNGRMRLTSIALIPLTIAFMVMVLDLVSKDYNAVRSYLGHPLPALLMLLFIGTGVLHMQIGMKSIIEDYVHGPHLKEAALTANVFFAVCAGLVCVYAVLRIGFG